MTNQKVQIDPHGNLNFFGEHFYKDDYPKSSTRKKKEKKWQKQATLTFNLIKRPTVRYESHNYDLWSSDLSLILSVIAHHATQVFRSMFCCRWRYRLFYPEVY